MRLWIEAQVTLACHDRIGVAAGAVFHVSVHHQSLARPVGKRMLSVNGLEFARRLFHLAGLHVGEALIVERLRWIDGKAELGDIEILIGAACGQHGAQGAYDQDDACNTRGFPKHGQSQIVCSTVFRPRQRQGWRTGGFQTHSTPTVPPINLPREQRNDVSGMTSKIRAEAKIVPFSPAIPDAELARPTLCGNSRLALFDVSHCRNRVLDFHKRHFLCHNTVVIPALAVS